MRTALWVVAGAASIVGASNASFVGWVGIVHDTGTHYQMDVFAGFTLLADKLTMVDATDIAANGTTFLQNPLSGYNRWHPSLGVAEMGDVDSFVTLGGYYDGESYICGDWILPSPTFTNYSTPNATTIPLDAGWMVFNTTTPQIKAISLDPFLVGGSYALGGAVSTLGVWVAHFSVLKDAGSTNGSVSFGAAAHFNDQYAMTDSRIMHFGAVPSPGALGLLALAGMAPRRRRRWPITPSPASGATNQRRSGRSARLQGGISP